MPLSDTSDPARWYVIHTKPKQEVRAEVNLQSWGLETFAPRLKEHQLPSALLRISYRIVPLFPGNIFARFDPGLLLAKVRFTRGVHSVVGFNQGAQPVDDGVIELIRSRIEEDGFVHVAEPQPGDTVEIICGPLRSLVGIFQPNAPGRERVAILLTCLGSHARVPAEVERNTSGVVLAPDAIVPFPSIATERCRKDRPFDCLASRRLQRSRKSEPILAISDRLSLRTSSATIRFESFTLVRPVAENAMPAKKSVSTRKVRKTSSPRDEVRPEYDFSAGKRGKYASRYPHGSVVVTLDADVAAAYPTAAAANDALRRLMRSTRRRRV